MNALAMPSSSRTAEERLSACFWAKSPRMREERSATDCRIFACSGSGCCISHDAIGALLARGAARVVEVMQVGYRLAHRKERLVQIELAPREQYAEQLARALRLAAQRLRELVELAAMVLLQ